MSPVTDPEDHRRQRLLEAAADLLATEGPHGLSLRRISAMAGGSTQLVYTLFGGKPGLADALYSEGFRRLGVRMHAGLDGTGLAEGDPERVVAIGRAYLEFASAEPAFFSLMFGRPIPGFTPVRTTRTHGRDRTFGTLVLEVQACLSAGALRGAPAEELARLCWLTVHGLASLRAAGMLPTDEGSTTLQERALRTPLQAHRP